MSPVSSCLFSERSRPIANRGSSSSSGAPMIRQNVFQWAWLPTATMAGMSAVRNTPYGARTGWLLPCGTGTAPVDR